MDLDSLVVDGQRVLTYRRYSHPIPTAEDATSLADLDIVVPAILDQLAGWWLTSESDALTNTLLEAGAELVRHGHLYRIRLNPSDIGVDPELGLPSGLSLEPLSASAQVLTAVSEAAYASDHPDFDSDHDTEAELAQLLAGTLVGPLIRDASWQLTRNGNLVAACVVNMGVGEPPFDGPWVSDFFRLPDPALRGAGTTLLRKSIEVLAAAGERSLGLVVTDGNPAIRLYERLGFVHHSSRRKIEIPTDESVRLRTSV